MAQSIQYEWRVVDEGDWLGLSAAELTASQPAWGLLGHKRQLYAPLLPILVATAMSWLATASVGCCLPQAPLEPAFPVAELLQRERDAWRSADPAALEEVLAPTVDFAWRQEWRAQAEAAAAGLYLGEEALLAVAAVADLRMVTLRVQGPTAVWPEPRLYRERRFFQAGVAGWQRTLPPPAFWGPEQRIATPHLRFHFHARDAETVLAVLDHSELVYVRLYALLGRALPAPKQPLFRLRPDQTNAWGYFGEEQPLTSPFLAMIPAGMSDADYLAQTVALRITNLLMDEIGGAEGPQQWRPLLWGLHGWLRSDLHLRRSPWHRRAEAHLRKHAKDLLPFRLPNLLEATDNPQDQQAFMRHYLVAEAAMGYMQTVHGRATLPRVLAALGNSDQRPDVLPRALGLSVAEFETGWNRFVETHYLQVGASQP